METLLVSKCLFGENVRYDGGHCGIRADYIARLKHKYKIILICPEVLAGMSIPREPIEIKNGKIISKSGQDMTNLFDSVKNQIKLQVQNNKIKYALLKEFSPSCGVHMTYDGTFTGTKIEGMGVITEFIKGLGVQVKSEKDVESLL